ncbi:UNVERIFIED_ORG: hypothetical protein J2W38_007064 [Variovorax paradoxus]|nr:hypothetical protein [Variovorax paradoxus]
MNPGRTETNWPPGMLRACESVESIAVKLAIFNRTDALAYEAEVRSCSPSALSRLLREPLHRVRVATERPTWVGEIEMLIEQSVILRESKWDAQIMATRRKYCPKCLESFYHSWIHDLSWMDRCFVHRRTELAVVPAVYLVPESRSIAKKLYAMWIPALENHIRSPEASLALFTRLSNRKLLHAAKALGALFEPSPSSEDSPGAFACHPVALNSWWKTIEERDGSGAIPWEKSVQQARLTHDDGRESIAGAFPDDSHEAPLAHSVSGPARNGVTGQGYARAEVGIVTQARAHTRAALACGLVSAIRQSTDNWLTRHHERHRHLRFVGQARFATYSAPPDFREHLAHVLATGARGRERLILKDFIARLSRGHERCLEALRKGYDRWDHLVAVEKSPTDSDYIAYHLRAHDVCARLVTLDLVTRMLRPHFLCEDRRLEVAERRSSPGLDTWQHAALRHQDLFGSHEWHPYKWAYQSTLVFPQDAEVQHFAHMLRAIEWAFFRRESRGHDAKPIDVALNGILNNQRMVVVTAEGVEEDFQGRELIYTYFSPDGADVPDWGALAERDPLHVKRGVRVLDEIRTYDLPSRWIDLLD